MEHVRDGWKGRQVVRLERTLDLTVRAMEAIKCHSFACSGFYTKGEQAVAWPSHIFSSGAVLDFHTTGHKEPMKFSRCIFP